MKKPRYTALVLAQLIIVSFAANAQEENRKVSVITSPSNVQVTTITQTPQILWATSDLKHPYRRVQDIASGTSTFVESHIGSNLDFYFLGPVDANPNPLIFFTESPDNPDGTIFPVEDGDTSETYKTSEAGVSSPNRNVSFRNVYCFVEIIDSGKYPSGGTTTEASDHFQDVIDDLELVWITGPVGQLSSDDWELDSAFFIDLDNDGSQDDIRALVKVDTEGVFDLNTGETATLQSFAEFEPSWDYANNTLVRIGFDDETVGYTQARSSAKDMDPSMFISDNLLTSTHRLVNEGILPGHDFVSSAITVPHNDGSIDYAEFTLRLSIEAIEDDMYISTTGGIEFDIFDHLRGWVTPVVTISSLSSSAEINGGFFRIDEGDAEEITLTVRIDGDGFDGGDHFYLRLTEINFKVGSVVNPDTSLLLDPEVFRTGIVNFQGL